MHRNSSSRRRLLAGLAALLGGGAASAQAPVPPNATPRPAPGFVDPLDSSKVDQRKQLGIRIDPRTGVLIVPVGFAGQFKPPLKDERPIKQVDNRNEDILDARVDAQSVTALRLVGRRPGFGQLKLTLGGPDGDTVVVYDVVVQPDFEVLKNVIKRAVPAATVDVIPGAGSAIILTGSVAKPDDAQAVLDIAKDATNGNIINSMVVGGSQHVLIDVVIARVNRSEARQRGFSFVLQGADGNFSSVLGGLITPFQNQFGSGITATATENITFGLVPGTSFLGALRALRSEGVAKIVSEPKIVTHSGRSAFIRSGGQQAIIGPAAGITGPGVILQPFGTELEVLPIVHGNGKIYIEVNPRISQPDPSLGVLGSPGFTEQQTRSSVMLESGQTFAIGGLIENQTSATSTRVPFLGDLPFVGTAFSTTSHNNVETELIILVTPRLVEPLDCAQAPRRVPGKETRSPDDYEFFLETLLEAPRGQRQVWGPNGYNAAYKCDPTYGKFPCIGALCNGGMAGCSAAGGCGAHAGSAATLTGLPATLTGLPATPPAPAVAPASYGEPAPAPTPASEPAPAPQ